MNAQRLFLPYVKLQELIESLNQLGYTCIGPQVREGAIVYDELKHMQQLPWGVRDVQGRGQYRLENISEQQAFAFSNGVQAIKPQLFKSREVVWKVIRNDEGKLEFKPQQAEQPPIAILGARACDIEAMRIQDKVFIEDIHQDPRYKKRRHELFVIAVNCGYASANCFCVSAGTGPEVKRAYDILMTEIEDGFVVQTKGSRAEALVKQLNLNPAKRNQVQKVKKVIQQTIQMQTKTIPLDNRIGLRDVLFNNLEHPRWQEVADRCLSCGNCTEVCPTCFCHSEGDKSAIDGSESEHYREWDSCFTKGHSNVNGHIIRDDTRKRYRQWLTHKVGSWFTQFGESGCVGCGRCIAFCPVGIDLTEELAAIVPLQE